MPKSLTKNIVNHKLSILEKLIIILVIFFYFCDFILYVGTIYNPNIVNPKNITLFLFVPLFLVLLFKKRIHLPALLGKPIVKWLIIYLIISIGSFLYALLFDLNSNSIYKVFRELIFSVLIIFLITGFFSKHSRLLYAQKCLIFGVLFSVLMNVAGFLGIFSISKTLGRASGFYMNPNTSGITLCLGMVLVTSKVPARWRTLFIFIVGIGVLLTFSKTAVFFYIIFLFYHLFFQKDMPKYMKVISCLAILAVAVYFHKKIVNLFNESASLNENVMTRLSVITNPLQHESNITGNVRVEIAKRSLHKYFNRPFIGYGLGADHSIELSQGWQGGTHNQYLAFLLDYGLLGAFLLFYYFIRLKNKVNEGKKKLFRNYILAFLFFCMFSHTLFIGYSTLFIHAFAWMILTSKARYSVFGNLDKRTVAEPKVEAFT